MMLSKASLVTATLFLLVGFAGFSATSPDIAGTCPAGDRMAVQASSDSDLPQYAPHFMPLNPEVAEAYKQAGQKVPLQMTEARFAEREDLTINQLTHTALAAGDSVRAIVLLVDFTDNPPGGPTTRFSPGVWDSMLFGDYYVRGGADTTTTKTLKRFYDEVSYGAVDIVTLDLPSVVGWLTAPNNYTYYCDDDGIHDNGFGPYPNNIQRLVIEAVLAADPVVDFSEYAEGGWVQNLFVVHAGSGAEWSGGAKLIWSHAWSIATGDGWGNTPPALFVDGVRVGDYSTEPECGGDTAGEGGPPMTPQLPTVGVYAHEFGHVLGLPDEYDYGYESNGTGRVSLMSGGSWNRFPDVYPDCAGNSPAHPSAWGAAHLGFLTPVEVTTTTTGITIPPVEQTGTNAVYKVTYPGTSGKEYWLFENRQQIGFDEGFSRMTADAHRLVIYHVDENVFDRTFWRPNEAECVDSGTYQGETNCDCASLPANPSNLEKGYGSSVEQADGNYSLELGTSGGYWQDFYSSVTNATAFDDTSSPNASSYYSHHSCDALAAARNIQEVGGNIILDLTPDSVLPSVTVNSPNGGESYDGGSMQTITWNATDNLGVTTVDIYLSVNGGSTYPFTVATGETNDGTYDWPVERVNSANCLIKVVAHDDGLNDGIDESDAAFEINTLILPAMSWPGIVFLLVAVAGVAFLLLLRRRRRT
jgi:M6 family metalloprotease-like protein